jgi:hypothetical protein
MCIGHGNRAVSRDQRRPEGFTAIPEAWANNLNEQASIATIVRTKTINLLGISGFLHPNESLSG